MWTRDIALEVLKSLEDFLAKHGFHCALGGSVMYRGDSEKDLDVIVYPHNKDSHMPIEELWTLICQSHFSVDKGGRCASSYRDSKIVYWLKTQTRKRIDFFFLK